MIRAIAGEYFVLTCDLFVRLEGAGFFGLTVSSDDEYSEVAKRYLPMRDGRLDTFSFDKQVVTEKLRRTLPLEIPDLASTLACSARKAVEEIRGEFEFLVLNNPFDFDEEKTFESVQWQQDLSDELENQGVDGLWIDPNYRERFNQVASALEEGWHQRHRSFPDENWSVRANDLGKQSDPHVALEKYQSLRNDMPTSNKRSGSRRETWTKAFKEKSA